MIKFEIKLSQEDVFDSAKKYFDKGEYWAYVNYISDKFELCSPKIKSKLLSMLANIYFCQQSFDKAILAAQFALDYDEANGDAMLCMARAYRVTGADFAFKETFMNFSFTCEDRIFDDISLIEHFNSLNQDNSEDGPALIGDNYRYQHMTDYAKDLLNEGNIAQATECFEIILQKFPDRPEVYNSLGFIYKTSIEEEKYSRLVEQRLRYFPNDLETIATYLFSNNTNDGTDREALYQKMLGMKIDNFLALRYVCCVVESREDYAQCLQLIDTYAQNYNCHFNHDLLVMKFNTLLKLGEKKEAKKLLTYLNIAYGMLGLGQICNYFLDCDKDGISISNISYMPDDLWIIAGRELANLKEDILAGKEISDERYWNVFELLVMSSDEEDIREYLLTYKNQFTLKNQSKIGTIIFMRDVTNIVKSGILVGLLSCGVVDFKFFQNCKIYKESFCNVSDFNNYPECYQEAYYYAFAYCGLNLTDFSQALQTSVLELLEAMSDTKRKFKDQFALAGAIICNTYLVLGDDVACEVARMIECNAKRLKRYISIIKKEGTFFDLNEDDMFEMFIKRISNKIIIPDSVDD